MKISDILYDPGSAPNKEDGAVKDYPYCVVVDGVTRPYSPDCPAPLFGSINPTKGLSGGEMAARVVEITFKNTSLLRPDAEIDCVFRAANSAIGRFQIETDLYLNDAGILAGCTFAGVKIDKDIITGLYGGDVFILCTYKNGKVTLTDNQVHGHDVDMNNLINYLKRQIAKERGITLEEAQKDKQLWGSIIAEMWNRFRVPLEQARREDVNNLFSTRGGYALLNGQLAVEELWKPFTAIKEDVKDIILFSDGLVPWEGVLKKIPHDEIATWVYENYVAGGCGKKGLEHLLKIARGIEEDTSLESYTTNAEATAIAIEF